MLYKNLPKGVGLRRITLHKTMNIKQEVVYLLLVECSHFMDHIGEAANLLPILRARICGYTGMTSTSCLSSSSWRVILCLLWRLDDLSIYQIWIKKAIEPLLKLHSYNEMILCSSWFFLFTWNCIYCLQAFSDASIASDTGPLPTPSPKRFPLQVWPKLWMGLRRGVWCLLQIHWCQSKKWRKKRI